MSDDKVDNEVDKLAEYFAATIGLPWQALTEVQRNNYRELAKARLWLRDRDARD